LTDSLNPKVFAASLAKSAQHIDVVLPVRLITKIHKRCSLALPNRWPSHRPDAEVLCWIPSMSVRFVSSKKEKGEKHQRRSHNAEAKSKNEHRVERGVVGH
jgi:hypothetical protein